MKFAAQSLVIATTGVLLIGASSASAASTFYFDANQNYHSVADSPFASLAGSSLRLENFESGFLSIPKVKATFGFVQGPSAFTDSVDADDGSMDGFGTAGHSYNSGESKKINFRFMKVNGVKPTMAGLVYTDGNPNARVTFKAWDSNGTLLGKVTTTLGDALRNGGTDDDRFFGITSDTGINRIQIISNFAGFEIDHLQFAYASAMSVVPIPPAFALGAVGLAGIAVLRRRLIRC